MDISVDTARRVASNITSSEGVRRFAPHGRHTWKTDGRAHIEVKGVHRVDGHPVADRLEHALRDVEGVHWAEVNPVLGRVVVAFDERTVGLDDLVDVVDSVEDEHGLEEDDLLADGREHPGDPDRVRWAIVEIGADAAGVAVGLFARFTRLPALPVDLAAWAWSTGNVAEPSST